jgi:exosortase/archaeosortase family protein
VRRKLRANRLLMETIIFLVKFNLLAIPMYLLILTNFSFQPLQNLIAQISYKTIKFFGYDATLENNLIGLKDKEHIIEISWDCTGWKSIYVLAALGIATPVNFKKKIKFLIMALPAIFIINLVRIITTLLLAANFGFEHIKLIDILLWRILLIVSIILLWYFWLGRLKTKRISR